MVNPEHAAAISCSVPVMVPVPALLFSADLLISQAFWRIFAFWPPLYRDLQAHFVGCTLRVRHETRDLEVVVANADAKTPMARA